MKTKLFTLFLVLAASIGITRAAVVNGTCGENLTWTLNTKDSTLTIEGSGEMTNWTSSSKVPWKEYRSYVSFVSLANGITNIGNYAFASCSNLQSATIPETITSIGESAFENCKKITNITIPSGVNSIGKSAFEYCQSVKEMVFPEGLTYISSRMFFQCRALQSITIPSSVTSISESAFSVCNALTAVHISDIAAWCNITFGQGNWTDYEANPISEAHNLYLNGELVEQLVIPEGITTIKPYAFYNCTCIHSISFPNSLNNISEYAFYGCKNITDLDFPIGLTSIGKSAFSNSGINRLTVHSATPPTGGKDCGISNTQSKLFVPQECIDTYSNTVWWEDFKEIRPIGSSYLVQFVDWDQTVLFSSFIDSGTAATPPANPTRVGYTFIGWDKDFSNITEDLVVTAQYKINRYYVQFLDWDNTVLKADSVDWNTAAVAPANPSRAGYDFIGWDKEFAAITSNLDVTAQYEFGQTTNYPMTFINGQNGEEIFDEVVTIKVPAAPTIAGFTFVKWEIVSGDLQDGFIIQATYKYEGGATETPAEVVNPKNPAQKLVRQGNVYILTEDKTYTVTGIVVK